MRAARTLQLPRILLLALLATACLLVAGVEAPGADAAVKLNEKTRKQILRSVYVGAPQGGRITRASCIGGRLSTVNRRWANAYLSNTSSCVRQYGGASGEGLLLKRRSNRARNWNRVGAVSDNCQRGAGGAPARVLRDLGCGVLYGLTAERGRCDYWKRSACSRERRCKPVAIVSEGVRARARIFTKGYSCRKARRAVKAGCPAGLTCLGSGEGCLYYKSGQGFRPWPSVRRGRYFRSVNIFP